MSTSSTGDEDLVYVWVDASSTDAAAHLYVEWHTHYPARRLVLRGSRVMAELTNDVASRLVPAPEHAMRTRPDWWGET